MNANDLEAVEDAKLEANMTVANSIILGFIYAGIIVMLALIKWKIENP